MWPSRVLCWCAAGWTFLPFGNPGGTCWSPVPRLVSSLPECLESRFMGGVKNQEIDEFQQGWRFTTDSVCDGCIDEGALEAVLLQHAEAERSGDYCGHAPAAPLDVLLKYFVEGLKNEYEDIDDAGVFYDGREGGYQWHRKWWTSELVQDYCYIFRDDRLLAAVEDTVHHRLWVEKGFIEPRRDDALITSWKQFSRIVMFEIRYVLWQTVDDDGFGAGEIPPAEILERLKDLVHEHDLVQRVLAGSRFWRAHTHSKPRIERTARRLGTAPTKRARSATRMSPAGIPKFYGAEDAETAIREVAYRSADKYVTYGQFEVTSDICIVDFTRVPDVPSMFDPLLGAEHREITFLYNFAKQISKRVKRKHKEFAYVPTQVVTEYLLHIAYRDNPIVGLRYESSRTGNECIVLDISNERCVDHETNEPGHLVLHADTVERRRVDDFTS